MTPTEAGPELAGTDVQGQVQDKLELLAVRHAAGIAAECHFRSVVQHVFGLDPQVRPALMAVHPPVQLLGLVVILAGLS